MRGGDPGSRSPHGSREGLGLNMSNVVPFPTSRRIMAKAIPREEFEQLAELALDVVQRIVTLLDEEEDTAAPKPICNVRVSLLSGDQNAGGGEDGW